MDENLSDDKHENINIVDYNPHLVALAITISKNK